MLALSLFVVGSVVGCGNGGGKEGGTVELLNVSYDPTRELWKDLNAAFIPKFNETHKKSLKVKQSHGGSGPQARSIIDGLEADVATLALWSDVDAIHKKGLIADGWIEKFPNRSLPYTSTIVFVVREGNPKNIQDWGDLVKGDVSVITPSPKTSGNGKLAFLAAWGSVIQAGGNEEQAQAFVTDLYRRVPVLDTGARGATTSFAQRGLGDVHLTWENEAHLELKEAGGKLQIIYPKSSILAEPHIAIVDKTVDRKGTREVAEEYLKFLYTPEGQEIIAKHHYRPTDAKVLEAHRSSFPDLELFQVTKVAESWDAAQTRFFAEGGVFDAIYQANK
ncbi:sulfate ABC transporter substrate-binding protein [Planctomicrobium sp. SH527]|uniref:sulfate ABC transporter substrate-binding protein n=1 Tax=Planctomicrobium sp. SH527 TaxID=3448123 RepID=UPI003F5B69D9